LNRSNALLLGFGSLLALAVSIPLEWLTIHNATMTLDINGMPQGMPSGFGPISLTVTGLNGHLSLGVKAPIWLLIVVGMVGTALSMLNTTGVTGTPRWIPGIPLAIAAIYFLAGLLIGLSGDASLGIGTFVALAGVSMGFVLVLRAPRPDRAVAPTSVAT
jgi:hypothetical protein